MLEEEGNILGFCLSLFYWAKIYITYFRIIVQFISEFITFRNLIKIQKFRGKKGRKF